MTIGRKLLLCCGSLLVAVMGLAYSSLTSIARLTSNVEEIAHSEAKKLDLTGQLLRDVTDMDAAQRSLALAAGMKSIVSMERYKEAFNAASARADVDLTKLAPLLRSDADERHAKAVRDALTSWREGYQEFLQVCTAGKDAQTIAAFVDDKLIPLMDLEDEAALELAQAQREQMEASEKDASIISQRARIIAMSLLGVVLLVGGIVLWVIRGINRSLRELTAGFSAAAAHTADSATQLTRSSQALAHGASEQAASLDETSASGSELNLTARRNAEWGARAVELTTSTKKTLVQANQALDTMLVAMDEVAAAAESISEINRVIEGIAFQTNILSLNAAVEAARAGELGMGFAVVAEEVRTLAQRSAQAARDTSALIETSMVKSRHGKNTVKVVSDALHSVEGECGRIRTLVNDVDQASQQQANRSRQIGSAVTAVANVTRQFAASAEEGAASAEEMSAQSASLQAAACRLAAMVGGVDVVIAQRPG